MILSHIAAMAQNKVIGVNGDLPWDIPEDMAFFKKKTQGHIILMGRKTFESFPQPLQGRLHIVLTRQENYPVPKGVHMFSHIEKALAFCQTQIGETWGKEVFIIGGGEIYRQTLDRADQLYLTFIKKEYKGNAYYPDFENDFLISQKEDRPGPPPFSFCLFKRKGS